MPEDEPERQIALERYQILDTLPDPAIDDLSKIAAQICGTPIGLVSLVDEGRQWFKAKCGIDATETSRDVSFCAHAILKPDDVFIISDALEDERFADNPLVVGEPHIRFYAGTPLVTRDGYALGSLCVIDRQPRELSPAQIDALTALGRQVIDQFEAHRTLGKLKQTISELHETRLSAVQNAKMSALGHLVSGVAHEINNPIGFIGSNLPHIRDYTRDLLTALALYAQVCPQPPPEIEDQLAELEFDYLIQDLPEVLNSMQQGVNRVVDIVRSLKTFVRNDEAEVKAIDLNPNLDHILRLFNQQLAATSTRPAIRLNCDYGHLPPLLCYPAQINQVFLNLLTNAINAINQQASVTADYCGQINVTTRAVGADIHLEVADNGIGILPDHAPHIFNPFFTTQAVGRGSGLGLASCYAIVTEQHQGSILYHPQPIQGSRFEVIVPIANPKLVTLLQHN
ncbi:MAG: GAF domain-containing sensor histidine kinase [Coleofasciculaceae cyanobacterium RL_1_1]|nr:GAF domain-containing sensor histidine kinase [Coleofasciculaceae cyanobacterium RL_1_1]